jgi:hypothetical protein
MLVQDKKPYITVKKARIARAGIQEYQPIEVAARNLTPSVVRDRYHEYRPPEVLIKNLDKFNMIPLTNEHPRRDVGPDNWKDYAVGFVGSSAAVEVLDSGELFITNDIVFYDRKAYEDYKNGKVEVSLGYDAQTAVVKDSDKTGYDFIMVDIPETNHLALCDRGRAGPNGRVLDSINAVAIAQKLSGGGDMGGITSVLSAFGIGKVKDSTFSLSGTVMDSLTKVAGMDAAALDKGLADEVTSVMRYLTPLGASEAKGNLVATVADSYKHAKDVLEKKEEVGKVLDALYTQCLEADKQTAQAVVDSITGKKPDGKDGDKGGGKDGDKEVEDEKKAAKVKDSASIIDEAVKTAMSSVTDSIIENIAKQLPGMVDLTVKNALGQGGGDGGAGGTDSRTLDSIGDFDGGASFLMKGLFPTAR